MLMATAQKMKRDFPKECWKLITIIDKLMARFYYCVMIFLRAPEDEQQVHYFVICQSSSHHAQLNLIDFNNFLNKCVIFQLFIVNSSI